MNSKSCLEVKPVSYINVQALFSNYKSIAITSAYSETRHINVLSKVELGSRRLLHVEYVPKAKVKDKTDMEKCSCIQTHYYKHL